MSRQRFHRPRLATIVLATLLLTLLLLPGGSRAYTPSISYNGVTTVWNLKSYASNVQNERVSWHTHPDGCNDSLGTFDDEFETIRDSFTRWEDVETSVMAFWEDTFLTAPGHSIQDRVNLIKFVEEELDPYVLGVTFPYAEGGYLVDCDILLNDDFKWSNTTPGRSALADLESVTTHEIGHFLGLDHSPLGQATMYYAYAPGHISTRSLEEDDTAGISKIYPAPGLDETYGRITGHIDVDGTNDERGIQVVAMDVATLTPFASALTRPDGSFEILAKPGFYKILATPARPSSALNSYWRSGNFRILPRPLTVDGSAIGTALMVKVTAPGETQVPDMFVRQVVEPLENDDIASRATPLRIGDMAAARFEANKNDDWFAFDANEHDVITITVHAEQIGSAGDPELSLVGTNATTTLAESIDIRPSLYSEFKHGIVGTDVDCLIENYLIKKTGRYFIRIQSSAYGSTGGKADYYVLSLTSGNDSPSHLTTSVTVSPDRLNADGVSTAEIMITPRTILGELIGPGLIVSIQHSGEGILSPVADLGTGTYTAVAIAPTMPGEDRLTVSIRGAGGSAILQDAARIVYVGPPDAVRTEIRAEPRRVPADGTSMTRITVVPRDVRGELVGTNVAVNLEYLGPTVGVLGPVLTYPDGTYAADLRAPQTESEATLRGVMNGTVTTDPVRVTFGYSLEGVVRAALIEIDALAQDASLGASARKRLVKAAAKLRRADTTLHDPRHLVPDVMGATKDIYRALKYLVKARLKSDDPTLAPSTEELIESMRRTVDGAASATGEARARYDAAVQAAADDDLVTAAKGFHKAYKYAVSERDQAHVQAVEVVLERSDTDTTLVARVVSGRLDKARLEGPTDARLDFTDTVDGARVYAADVTGAIMGDYALVIEPGTGGGTSQTITFEIDDDIPPLPVILTPPANAIAVSLTPRFVWAEVTGAEKYTVVVTTTKGDAVFGATIQAGAPTEVTIPAALALDPNARHVLELRAVNAGGNRSLRRLGFTTETQ
jgi:matrixin/invasin-like protein